MIIIQYTVNISLLYTCRLNSYCRTNLYINIYAGFNIWLYVRDVGEIVHRISRE